MPMQTEDPKPKPASKSELILEVALEAQYFRNPDLGLPFASSPTPRLQNPSRPARQLRFQMLAHLTLLQKHGFIASTALINSTIRYLTGLAMFDESISVWDNEAKQVTTVRRQATTAQSPTAQPNTAAASPIPATSAKQAPVALALNEVQQAIHARGQIV